MTTDRSSKRDGEVRLKARRREAQYNALMELSVEDYDSDEDAKSVTENLLSIRAEVAARRRARATGAPTASFTKPKNNPQTA